MVATPSQVVESIFACMTFRFKCYSSQRHLHGLFSWAVVWKKLAPNHNLVDQKDDPSWGLHRTLHALSSLGMLNMATAEWKQQCVVDELFSTRFQIILWIRLKIVHQLIDTTIGSINELSFAAAVMLYKASCWLAILCFLCFRLFSMLVS